MNDVYHKITFKYDDYMKELFFLIPIETNHHGIWEKEFVFDDNNCLPMLDCTQDNIISKKMFRFFDTPPYREIRDEEEEYNCIMSRHYIVLSDDCHHIESIYYDNKQLHAIDQLNIDVNVDNCLLISTMIK